MAEQIAKGEYLKSNRTNILHKTKPSEYLKLICRSDGALFLNQYQIAINISLQWSFFYKGIL